MAAREVLLEKKFDTKYMQVNIFRNIASITKRGNHIPTHSISRQCPDVLGMRQG